MKHSPAREEREFDVADEAAADEVDGGDDDDDEEEEEEGGEEEDAAGTFGSGIRGSCKGKSAARRRFSAGDSWGSFFSVFFARARAPAPRLLPPPRFRLPGFRRGGRRALTPPTSLSWCFRAEK